MHVCLSLSKDARIAACSFYIKIVKKSDWRGTKFKWITSNISPPLLKCHTWALCGWPSYIGANLSLIYHSTFRFRRRWDIKAWHSSIHGKLSFPACMKIVRRSLRQLAVHMLTIWIKCTTPWMKWRCLPMPHLTRRSCSFPITRAYGTPFCYLIYLFLKRRSIRAFVSSSMSYRMQCAICWLSHWVGNTGKRVGWQNDEAWE